MGTVTFSSDLARQVAIMVKEFVVDVGGFGFGKGLIAVL